MHQQNAFLYKIMRHYVCPISLIASFGVIDMPKIYANETIASEIYFMTQKSSSKDLSPQIVNSPMPGSITLLDVVTKNIITDNLPEEKFILGQLTSDSPNTPTPEFYDDIENILGSHQIRDIILSGVAKSNLVKSALGNVRAAQFAIDEANSAFLPSVNASGSYGYSRNDGNARLEGARRDVSINVTQNLDLSGQLGAQEERQQANFTAEQHKLDAIKSEVSLDVARAYSNTIKDYLFMKAREEHVTISKQTIENQKKRIAQGLGNRLELSQLEIQLSGVKTDLHRAQSLLATTRGQLEELSGVINASPSLDSLLLFIGTQKIDRDDLNIIIGTFHPRIKEASARARAAEAQVEFLKKDFYPKTSLGITAQNVSHDGTTTESVGSTMDMNLPLYDGGLRQARLNSGEANLSSAREDIIQTQSEIYLRALADYNLSQALFQSYESLLISEKEALQFVNDAERLLESDIGTIEQVISAQRSYIDTKLAIINIQFEYINTYLALLHNTGILLKVTQEGNVDNIGGDIAFIKENKG